MHCKQTDQKMPDDSYYISTSPKEDRIFCNYADLKHKSASQSFFSHISSKMYIMSQTRRTASREGLDAVRKAKSAKAFHRMVLSRGRGARLFCTMDSGAGGLRCSACTQLHGKTLIGGIIGMQIIVVKSPKMLSGLLRLIFGIKKTREP